mmetsp:Transcript_8341/g.13050  ORF Transcript_8341/g.13050 Transcript_8341/m.13050 type:complete len:354 (+) Transcript_8341:60-1121(+)
MPKTNNGMPMKRRLLPQSTPADEILSAGIPSAVDAAPANFIHESERAASVNIVCNQLQLYHQLVEPTVGYSTTTSVEEPPTKIRRKDLNDIIRFRPYQAEKWQERYQELLDFREEHGHCLVPHTYPLNPELGRWVKRQRYHYSLLMKGKQTSMTVARVKLLEEIGFVWDSHEVVWQDKFNDLLEFKQKHGHCEVPSGYPENPKLSTWVKCQRRQYKLFSDGQHSNMTAERALALEKHGFKWELRMWKNSQSYRDTPKQSVDTLSKPSSAEPNYEALLGSIHDPSTNAASLALKKAELDRLYRLNNAEQMHGMLVQQMPLQQLPPEAQLARNFVVGFDSAFSGANSHGDVFSNY